MKQLTLVICVMLSSTVFSQTANEEEVFTVRAKDLPVMLIPRVDTILDATTQKFEVHLPKGYEVDSSVFLKGSISWSRDSFWLTPNNTNITLLKIYGKKKGSNNVLVFKKKFVVIEPFRAWGFEAPAFFGGLGGGITLPDTTPPPQRTLIKCLVNNREMKFDMVLSQNFFIDTLARSGFELYDTAAHQKIRIGLFSMGIYGAKNQRHLDSVYAGNLSDSMILHIKEAPDLSKLHFSFYDSTGRRVCNLQCYLRTAFEPLLFFNGQVLSEGMNINLNDLLSHKPNSGFTLAEEKSSSTNYKISSLELHVAQSKKNDIKLKRSNEMATRLPVGVFQNIKRKANVTLVFKLTHGYNSMYSYPFGKPEATVQYNIAYSKKPVRTKKHKNPIEEVRSSPST